MNPALDEAVARLGMALLHFLWQGALIGCISAAGLALLRNARSQTRYAFCGVAMLLCLVLPLWQLLTPAEAGIPPAAAPTHSHVVTAAVPHSAATLSTTTLQPSLPAVVLVWSIGAALMSLRLLLGIAWVWRLGAAASAAVDPLTAPWQERLAVLARRMGLRRLPRLRLHEGIAGPVTVGRWRPLILLPASLVTHMPPELLEALLAHELAHVRRFDYIANLLQSIVEVLLFYHPVVWWLSSRIRLEREQIADDLAAEALGEPRRLARALSELAQFQSTPHRLALAAGGGSLMTRITRLIRPTRQPLGWKLLLPIAGLTAMAIAAHATGLTTAATPPSPTSPVAPASPAAPVTPPAPVAPTAPGTKPTGDTITLHDAQQSFAFALVSGSGGPNIMSGNERDLREVKSRHASIPGDFLWIRQGKLRYVVTDPSALAEVKTLWAPVQAFDAEMETLSQQIDAQAEVVERIAHEVSAAHDAPSAELDALHKQMDALQKQRDKVQTEADKLARRMAKTRDEKLLAQLEQQQEQLDKTLEPLDESIDALSDQIERIGDAREQAMEQAHAKQEQDADKIMDELSDKMDAVSQKQEAAAQAAEQRLRALIVDFQKRGLAKQG
jgi:beta-lactamase regulating signal transducer with metallopeptidase domain/predicted  nucleic acid-binding Zn-ribbon protein